jgi:hypothetical protein
MPKEGDNRVELTLPELFCRGPICGMNGDFDREQVRRLVARGVMGNASSLLEQLNVEGGLVMGGASSGGCDKWFLLLSRRLPDARSH